MKLTITIPKPCHENWEAMTPQTQGRHCAQCDHVVADLTRATDAELVALFTSDARPKCARFDPRQLDRVMSNDPPQRASAFPVAAFTSLLAVAAGSEALAQQGAPIRTVGEVVIERPAPQQQPKGKPAVVPHSIPPTDHIRTGQAIIDTTIRPITGDTVVFVQPRPVEPAPLPERDPGPPPMLGGPVLRTVSAEDPLLQQLELGNVSVELVPSDAGATLSGAGQDVVGDVAVTLNSIELCGQVQDAITHEPLPFVTIRSATYNTTTQTDFDGNFRMRVPVREADDLLVLDLNYVAYENRTAEVFLKTPDGKAPAALIDAPLTPPIDPRDRQGVSGFVRLSDTDAPMSGAVVRVKGSTNAVRCDSDGRFFIRVDEATSKQGFELEVVDEHGASQVITLHAGAVPCCVPVHFDPAPVPDRSDNTCMDLGVLTMSRSLELHTVGAVVIVRQPTGVARIFTPFRRAWRKLTH